MDAGILYALCLGEVCGNGMEEVSLTSLLALEFWQAASPKPKPWCLPRQGTKALSRCVRREDQQTSYYFNKPTI